MVGNKNSILIISGLKIKYVSYCKNTNKFKKPYLKFENYCFVLFKAMKY